MGNKRIAIGIGVIRLESENELEARNFSGGPLAYLQPSGRLWWWLDESLADYIPGFDYLSWVHARLRKTLGA